MKLLNNKTTKEILRDCLKVVPFMKENNKNLSIKITRKMILNEFRKNKNIQDLKKINDLRRLAIEGMSNYYVNMVKQQYLNNKDFYDNESKMLEEELK